MIVIFNLSDRFIGYPTNRRSTSIGHKCETKLIYSSQISIQACTYRYIFLLNAIISNYGVSADWNNPVMGYCDADNSRALVHESLVAKLMGIQTHSVARSMHVASTCCLFFLTHPSGNTEHLTVVRRLHTALKHSIWEEQLQL